MKKKNIRKDAFKKI